MVVLYEHPLSPYAQKVKIALNEKGVPFESHVPDIVGGDVGEFATINPRLEVPTLVDDDVAVFDSTVILEYLEDRWPTPPLLPTGAADRARVRMLEELCDTYYEAINWAVFEIQVFQRATGELADRLQARAAAQQAGCNAYLDRALGTRPYFNGDSFGWGDLSVAPYVAASASMDNRPPAGTALAAWLDRVLARPSVAETNAEARNFSTADSGVAEAVSAGLFKREYRDHRLEWMMKSGGVDIVLKGLEAGNIRFTGDFA